MATVFATKAYDMRSYNFHALDGTTTLKPFLDKPYTVTGTTYADRIEAIHKDGSGSLVFASPNIVAMRGSSRIRLLASSRTALDG